MRFRTLILAATIAGLGITTATAAGTPQEVREGLMKKIGGSMGALAAIAKGEKPYDAAVVKASLTTMSDSIKAFPDQFPVGSEANSSASPKIWENMDDFKAKAAKFGGDTDALIAQLPADAAGVGVALGALGQDCGSCHQVYRIKK